MKSLLVFSLFLVLGQVVAMQWDQYNDPRDMPDITVYNAYKIPLSGRLLSVPWSDSYWPSNMAGIAQRWYRNVPQTFGYPLYSMQQLKMAPAGFIASLSPAEKYDIFMGRYDFPTVKAEWSRTSPSDQGWEGLCHGWAAAAQFFEQPSPITIRNKDGIVIPFGSSDIKALLTFYMGQYVEPRAMESFIGRGCKSPYPNYNSPECADVNAGSLHLAFANLIGLKKKGFIFDREPSNEVWNQPAYNYTIQYLGSAAPGPYAAPGTKVQQRMRMWVVYADETGPSWNPAVPRLTEIAYDYWLELDGANNVIGGTYAYSRRPDFLWTVRYDMSFNGYFSGLRIIYAKSVGGAAAREENLPPARESSSPGAPFVEELTAPSGSFKSKTTADGLYPNNLFQAWSIHPPNANKIIIKFTEFSTQRNFDMVKIYEGSSGEGPLLYSLHGKLTDIPSEIVVDSPSVYVVFATNPRGQDKGFTATYTSEA